MLFHYLLHLNLVQDSSCYLKHSALLSAHLIHIPCHLWPLSSSWDFHVVHHDVTVHLLTHPLHPGLSSLLEQNPLPLALHRYFVTGDLRPGHGRNSCTQNPLLCIGKGLFYDSHDPVLLCILKEQKIVSLDLVEILPRFHHHIIAYNFHFLQSLLCWTLSILPNHSLGCPCRRHFS